MYTGGIHVIKHLFVFFQLISLFFFTGQGMGEEVSQSITWKGRGKIIFTSSQQIICCAVLFIVIHYNNVIEYQFLHSSGRGQAITIISK